MPPVAKLRGESLLLVIGIIMIVYGAISAGSGTLTSTMSASTASGLGLGESAVEYFNLVGILALAEGAVLLVFGILGIVFRKRADKVYLLIVLGIIHIIAKVFMTMYSNLLNEMGAPFNARILEITEQMTGISMDAAAADTALTTIGGLVLAFILPALFLLGALLNKLPPKIPAHLQEFYAQQGQDATYTQSPPQPGVSRSPYEPGYHPPEKH